MRNLLGATFLTALMSSCIFIRMDDSIDLGSKYRYTQDYPQTIIYHVSSEYKGIGTEIVPPIVDSYAFNDRYIIAKSQEVDEMTGNPEGKPIHYWIIDKELEVAAITPMDSITFYATLKEKQIKLNLKYRKFHNRKD